MPLVCVWRLASKSPPFGGEVGSAIRCERAGASAKVPHDTLSIAPYIRSLADHATKHIREVRLIAHAATLGDRAERGFRGEHQSLGELDPSASDPELGGRAECPFELPAEVAEAEIEKRREISYVDPGRQRRFDMRDEASRLPPWEPSACRKRLHSNIDFTHASSVQRLSSLAESPVRGEAARSHDAGNWTLRAQVQLLFPK